MNHETMLAYLMGQRRGGGSSGGEATYWWVPFCADGVTWMGETVDNGAELAGGFFDTIDLTEVKTKQYRVTVDGVSYLCTDNGSHGPSYVQGNYLQIESDGCPATIIAERGFDPVVVTFADGNSHTLKVEAWVGEEPYVEGGGSSGGGDIDALIDRSITEIHSNVESIGYYAFYNCAALTTADFPAATSIGYYAFYNCETLAAADFPAVTSIGYYAFYGCGRLATADFPAATSISNDAFYNCETLAAADFPAATSIGKNAFQSCDTLATADFPAATSIGKNAFQSCGKLQSFILRNTEQVCTLSNTSAFNSTPITSGTGYIYVPRALVDSYKAATNWSTYADQIRALEDYTVDGTTTGALDETKI